MARRICIFRHNFYPIDVRVSRQATALLAAGFEVDVVCLREANEPSREHVRGVSIYRLPVTHRRASRARYVVEYLASFLAGMLTLSALFLRRRYDVVQVSNMPDFLVFAAIIPKLLGAKIVLDVLDSMPELYMAKYGVGEQHLMTRLIAWQEGISIRFADRVITVTDEFRKLFLRRHGRLDIPIILNLPDHTRLPRRMPNQETFASNGHDDRFILIAHGVLLPRLGFDTMIRAVASIADEIPRLELRIVGSGQNEEELRALAVGLGVADRVKFLGFVQFDQLPGLLDDADVGLVANKRDGFAELLLPTKLLELVWMGKPVVAARTPTIAHYFDDSMLAFFEPDDDRDLAARIRDLYYDPALRFRLAHNASRFFDRHNWQSEGVRYSETLLELLRAPPSAQPVASS
jgi:glycosyltransferase involved in cell wall biosynthesis